MGKKNYLIEGVSGAGKTTVAEELTRRGYQAVHGDRELRYRGDPITGEPISPGEYVLTPDWMSEHQLWDIKKVSEYIENKTEGVTFFCGGSRNFSKFVGWLDGVFILEVDRDTMIQRIEKRVAADPNDFGARPDEMDLILKLYDSRQDIPSKGIAIDANQPLIKVVDDIISYIEI